MKLLSRILVTLALLLGLSPSAMAAQADCTLPTTGTLPGLTLVNSLNGCHSSLIANFSAASAPGTPIAYQWWQDTTTGTLKVRNGANSAWLILGSYNGTVGFQPFNGGVGTNAIASGGTGTALTLTYSPAATAYVTGQTYAFIANVANTGAVTLNINGLGAKNITKKGTVALAANDIVISQVVEVQYDGTQMQVISPLASALDASGGNFTGALNFAQGADVASAGTTNLCTATGNYVHVTGTVTITSFGTCQAGTWRIVRFTGALTLTYNAASMILPTAANILTVADDRIEAVSLGSGNWIVTNYQRASGTAILATDIQTFTAGGTWTRPAGASRILAECWGAGGSGGKRNTSNAGGGAGGGAYVSMWLTPAQAGASQTVTIGTGGTAQASANTSGVTGGNTTFGAVFTAFGGEKGDGTGGSGGGGGGALTAGGVPGQSNGGLPTGQSGGTNSSGFGGATGSAGAGGDGGWGGGGGGGGVAVTGLIGGKSFMGGGGGGGAGCTTGAAGGTSVGGGAGGAGGSAAGAGTAGTAPGGGGGGSCTGTSGAGADGKCIFTSFP